MIPTYIISVLIGFVLIASVIVLISRMLDCSADCFGGTCERPQPPKPQSPRKGLSEGDGVTINHGGSNR